MPVPEPSRRTLLTGISFTTAVGLSGCLQGKSRYQVVFNNSSNTSVSGEVSLSTEKGNTISSTSLDLSAGESTHLIVSTTPHETTVDLDSRPGRSNFVWQTPSCVLVGMPTQTFDFENGTTGVEYGCNRSRK